MSGIILNNRWAQSEVGDANLGDARLNNRLINLVDSLGKHPEASIPANCSIWNETKAAYRFFDNGKVSSDKILAPHRAATLKRIKAEKIVLCAQDTTDIDYTGRKSLSGLGYTGNSTQQYMQGFFLHPTLAITPDRLCLGVLQSQTWIRDTPPVKGKKNKSPNIEDKESVKWLTSFKQVKELAVQVPDTLFINVSDRESDIYELFLERDEKISNAHFIMRSTKDRRLADSDNKLWDEVKSRGSLGEIEFIVPDGRGRKSRQVTQEIRIATVELTPPHRTGKKLDKVQINIVLASEINTPEGEEPIEWFLLTSLDVSDYAKAVLIIDYYLCRWQIEIYFKVLKSGCKLEEIQLENIDRIKNCLAIYMIIAWRILFTTMLGRVAPDIACDKVFSDDEWKSVYMILKKQRPPEIPPSLNEMIKMIAQFGGFLNRRGDGEPGVKTMWLGLQRMRDFAAGREFERKMPI